ncbi:class I SAM-dependent methyltransferase [Rhodopirellula europaea]|uniref:Methyltransferase type 11 n=1 Tax=Rhodopirellula europaea SH398 TaxID=1263868 RepID=M5SC38_9BACT|nr:class I SAM-dependent methyltransferase [Rhodopirellula europaea]EMI29065.1 methyltransferase type 11 [Rhodopirellula europaea SH398]
MQSTRKINLQCPVCGIAQFRFRFEKKGRDFWRCMSCAGELLYPLPTVDELDRYYEESYSEGMYSDFAAAQTMKRMTAHSRLSELSRYVPSASGGRWLDVGCADGTFVAVAKEKGADAQGVELSATAVELARQAGLNVHSGTVDSLPNDARFDTITAFDVIEHVLDPRDFIRALRMRVRDGGHIVLTLPDLNSMARRLMGSRWYFYIPEEHLHYFNRQNLSLLLQEEGFTVKAACRTYKPLTFDYSLVQFAEYNPMIHRVLSTIGNLMPSRLRSKVIPLPIGEMMLIGQYNAT